MTQYWWEAHNADGYLTSASQICLKAVIDIGAGAGITHKNIQILSHQANTLDQQQK